MAIKKQWYEIIAPKMFDEKKIGDTLTSDPKHLVGRTISVSLADLTGDYSKFYTKLLFRIESIDDKAYVKFIGHECMQERIYRMVHRYMRRVDCVEDVVTKDNNKVRIKVIFILLKRVNTSIKDSARRKTRELLNKIAAENTFNDFINMILKDELQNTIRKEVSKIYPVGNIEIRKSELMEEKTDKIAELIQKKPETKAKKEFKKEATKPKKDSTKPKKDTRKEAKQEAKPKDTEDKIEDKPKPDNKTKDTETNKEEKKE